MARLCATSRGGRRIALPPPPPAALLAAAAAALLPGVGGPGTIAVGFVGVANGVDGLEPRREFARDELADADAPLSRLAVLSMRVDVGEVLFCMRV